MVTKRTSISLRRFPHRNTKHITVQYPVISRVDGIH